MHFCSQGPKTYILNALVLLLIKKMCLKNIKWLLLSVCNMLSCISSLPVAASAEHGGGVLEHSHADYHSPIYPIFPLSHSRPQLLSVPLCEHTQVPEGILGKFPYHQIFRLIKHTVLVKVYSREAQVMVSTAIPCIPVGNW